MLNFVERSLRDVNGRLKMMLRLVVILGMVGLVPGGLRMLMPVMLTVAEILLGIGQACVTFLRMAGQ